MTMGMAHFQSDTPSRCTCGRAWPCDDGRGERVAAAERAVIKAAEAWSPAWSAALAEEETRAAELSERVDELRRLRHTEAENG